MAVRRRKKAKRSGKWIKKSIEHPGAFTRKAKAAGETVAQYASDVLSGRKKVSTTTKKEAVLARTLREISHRRKKRKKKATRRKAR